MSAINPVTGEVLKDWYGIGLSPSDRQVLGEKLGYLVVGGNTIAEKQTFSIETDSVTNPLPGNPNCSEPRIVVPQGCIQVGL